MTFSVVNNLLVLQKNRINHKIREKDSHFTNKTSNL